MAPLCLYSQHTVKGKITDTSGLAVEFANVLLKNKDGKIEAYALTDKVGLWSVQVNNGNYIIEVYQFSNKVYSEKIIVEKNLSRDIVIEGVLELDQVIIEHRKKMITTEADKLIMKVQGNPLFKGRNTFEILRFAPYVWIDGSTEAVSIKQNAAVIWINGKPSNMSPDVLNNFLKTLSNEEIETIEIITNPSAKYSAAGSSIINIITKRSTQKGVNAVVTSVTSISQFINSYNSVQLNSFISEKLSLTTYYVNNQNKSMRMEDRDEQLSMPRTEYNYVKVDTTQSRYEYISTALLYDFNTKNQSGFNIYYLQSNNITSQNNDLTITDGAVQQSIGDYLSRSTSKVYNLSFNHSYRSGSFGNFSTIVDYFKSNSEATNNYYNLFLENDIEPQTFNRRKSYSPTNNNIFSAQADYEANIKESRVEVGFRYSLVDNTNETLFENDINGLYIPDPTFTNDFNYREKITAGYISFRTDSLFKSGVSLLAGLRAEYTDGKGNIPSQSYTKSRNYLDVFPSIFLNRNIGSNSGIGLSYSRRIYRPGYSSFNPTIFYLTDFTSSVGNPELKPSYTNAFEATYNSPLINLMVYYNKTDGEQREILKRLSDTELRYQWRNIDDSQQIGLSISANKKVNNWLQLFLNASCYNKIYKSTFQDAENIDAGKATFQGRFITAFTFSDTFRSDISFEYNGPETYGQFTSAENYAFYINASKKINDRLSIFLKVVDPFDQLRYAFNNTQSQIRTTQYRNNFSRTISLYCVINFATGRNTKDIQIKNSNQDLKNRAN